MTIDFVITWVDDSDKDWVKEKNKYIANEINSDELEAMTADKAYRDWGMLRYWFRAVEKFAPWVNKIYFVTYGHVPSWLNLKHSKLVIINHQDFIDKDALPTFNSRAIEVNLHRIEDLSPNFVYFNDDFILNNYVTEKDFFVNNLPKDNGVLSPIIPIKYGTASVQVNEMEIINKYFKKNNILKANFNKWFTLKYGSKLLRNVLFCSFNQFIGFFEPHLPVSFLKETFVEVWDVENQILNNTTYSKFKENSNVNQWLFRYWQIASGNFVPRELSFGKYYELSNNNQKMINDILKSKHKVICVNDTFSTIDFKGVKKELISTFNKKFPNSSSFEGGMHEI